MLQTKTITIPWSDKLQERIQSKLKGVLLDAKVNGEGWALPKNFRPPTVEQIVTEIVTRALEDERAHKNELYGLTAYAPTDWVAGICYRKGRKL